jgi:hypothetical protein
VAMAIAKGKPDGGQGGKLGHSNQDHWEYTEEIKLAAKKRRRLQARKETCAGLNEYLAEKKTNLDSFIKQ